MPPSESIQLGDRSYHLVPQRIGFLRTRFKAFIRSASDLDASANDVVGVLGDQAHAALSIFIPGLMPEHEFAGFASADALAENRRAAGEHEKKIADLNAELARAGDDGDESRVDALAAEIAALEANPPDDVGYDPSADRSPTTPEIIDAFNACMRINRFDLFKHLKGVVGGDFLRAWVQRAMADFLT